jgi:hypothetical protein
MSAYSGESDFVKEVLSEQEEKFNRRYRLRSQGYDFEKVVKRAAEVVGIGEEEIWKTVNQLFMTVPLYPRS